MAERRNLLPLLLDEVVLVLVYFVTRFRLEYFVVLLTAVILKDIIVVHKAWEVMNTPHVLGIENLIKRIGVVVGEIDPAGQIKVGSEIWKAESSTRIEVGARVIVWGNEGLSLKVRRYEGEYDEG